jgi:hypothetical protein
MLALIFPSRNYITLGLIPFIIALVIAVKTKWNGWAVFGIVFFICGLLFFSGKYIHPKLNFPQKVLYRQTDFQLLKGNSRLDQRGLQPGFGSFVRNLPEALDHSLLRPYLWQSKGIFELAASLEVILLLSVFILMLVFPSASPVFKNKLSLFLLFFIFNMLLLIGYTVPFTGSIVRYRSIYLMLLLVIFSLKIDWIHLKSIILNKK